MKTFHFLGGLPRSGSSVLAAILNQNPSVYVTPTSPLLELLVANQDTYWKTPAVIANPNPQQLTDITRAMINATWAHRKEPIIIDKNRGWGKNMPASSILFEKDIKMIATVRDLPSIMASWMTLLRLNPHSFMDRTLREKGYAVTDENRMGEMWFNMVKDCMECIVQARKDAGDRLFPIDYDLFMYNPRETLMKIEIFLNLPHYDYDIENIISFQNDDDLSAWGLDGMHQIRPRLQKTSRPAREILGDKLYDRFVELDKQYQYR